MIKRLYFTEVCPEAQSSYVCADNTTFLNKSLVCDGIAQCPDGDDETNCSKHSAFFYIISLCDRNTSTIFVRKCISVLLALREN